MLKLRFSMLKLRSEDEFDLVSLWLLVEVGVSTDVSGHEQALPERADASLRFETSRRFGLLRRILSQPFLFAAYSVTSD